MTPEDLPKDEYPEITEKELAEMGGGKGPLTQKELDEEQNERLREKWAGGIRRNKKDKK